MDTGASSPCSPTSVGERRRRLAVVTAAMVAVAASSLGWSFHEVTAFEGGV
jgi:hypothetical protein